MTIKKLLHEIEKWIPQQIAWEKDNVGLQVGNENETLKNILISLDISSKVVAEAISKSANLIITHHPLLFHAPKSITQNSIQGKIITELLRSNISCYAAHTNLDSVNGGVNTTIANLLNLENIEILSPLNNSLCKFVVFVPEKNLEKVADAIHSSGGGMFLKYDKCSFRTKGVGTFRGDETSNPSIGKPMQLEFAEEVKLEVLTEKWKIPAIIKAVKENHPYEEVAYDVVQLNNSHNYFGIGAVGNLKLKMKKNEFLEFVKQKLKAKVLKHSGSVSTVNKVAICGGSGSKYISDAIKTGANAFITSDLSYHSFQDYEDKILLIDAGHFETENHVLIPLKNNLDKIITKYHSKSKVYLSKKMKNPVSYF